MLKLHLVQADHGDCLILEHGKSSSPRYILIDGGPSNVYKTHLRGKLREIKAGGGKLDLAILSHVDDDHIVGLLDLMTELRQQRKAGVAETIAIEALWHNTFSQNVGRDIGDRFKMLMQDSIIPRGLMTVSNRAAKSIGQGDELTQNAYALNIPINPKFEPERLVCVDNAPTSIHYGNLKLQIVGPTVKNLRALRTKWLAWLKEQEKRLRVRSPAAAARAAVAADESIPNLSSIMVFAKTGRKTLLLTGDGRGDDLLEGLDQAKLLDPNERLHVNVLKLPHHGSQRNVTPKFLEKVTADQYVICANGKNGNPDWNTLEWLVQTAKKEGRSIDIFVTNRTDSTRRLVEKYDPNEYGYRLIEMNPREHSMVVELAP
jgi:beta-lactamase superfamily II metal-dependent hydrolase